MTGSPMAHRPLPRRPISLEASVLYALVRLGAWPGLSASDLQAARQALLDAPLQDLPRQMRNLARSGMPQSIVPFRRDELDIAMAAVLAGAIVPAEFGTSDAHVDAGFFKLNSTKVTYVDHASCGRTPESRLLDPPAVEAMLRTLRTLPIEPMHFVVPPDTGSADDVLHVCGPLLAPCLPEPRAPSVKIWLIHPETQRHIGSLIGEADCELRGSTLVLRGLRPEVLMELQAASLSGAWLKLVQRHFACLGPLPDLLEPGASRPAHILLTGLLENGLGALPAAFADLDADVAERFLRHVPWAWMHPSHDLALRTSCP